MNSLLLWIGGLLVAVLGLLFAVPHLVDWNAYRGVFEEEATRILGRDVRVGGKVNLRLLPSPYVRFEKVRISDAGAALGEPFFRAEAFTLWLSPAPLLRGAIEANEVELDRPVLRLAVDAGGNGNWQKISITPGSLPFVPSEVVLQQVRIRDGIVSLRTPSTPEPLTLSGIDGELAASALDGPYRFRGNVRWGNALRELRIATSQREPTGQLRYKASVRALDSGHVYSFDGTLSELSARARNTGVLTARLPLTSFVPHGHRQGQPPSQDRTRGGRVGDVVDLKANVEGDIDSMRLSDLQLGFEQAGKPQLVAGDMVANWRNGLRMETRLASRWLDLDQLAGLDAAQPAEKAAPADIVRRVVAQIGSFLPVEGTSLLTVDIDQLNLGAEPLSGVRLALVRTGGLTSIGELRAALPGNVRGELRGRFVEPHPATSGQVAAQPTVPFSSAAAATAFDGEIMLHGSGFRRFMTWAGMFKAAGAPANAADPVQPAADGAFSLASRLRVLAERLTLSDASIELAGRHVAGVLDWQWGRERRLDLTIEGPAIDVSALAPGLLSLEQSRAGGGTVAGEPASTLIAALAAHAAAVERTVGRLRLRARAQSLSDGATTLTDVDADITLRGNGVEIAGLRFTGGAGARVDVRGEMTALAAEPRGTLRGWIGAGSPAGIAGIVGLLPQEARRITAGWLGRVEATDLGFVLALGGAQSATTLAVDGLLDDVRVGLGVKLDGGLDRWRDAPIDLALDLDGPSAPALMRAMAGYAAPIRAPSATVSAEGGVVRIKATGRNAGDLVGLVVIETATAGRTARAQFDGRVGIEAATGSVALNGSLALDAQAGDLLALTGGQRSPTAFEAPVRGVVQLRRTAEGTRFSGRNLSIGASSIGGELILTGKGERTRVEARLTTGQLALLDAAGIVLAGQRSSAETVDTSDATSPWPDTPLSLALLDRVEGQIVVNTPRAVLADGLEIADAVVDVGLSPGRLTLASLTGAVMGGRITIRGAAVQAPAGADLSLDTRITGAELSRLAGGVAGQSKLGEANLSIALAGRATSLRAAVSQLTGRGEIELRNAAATGIAPDVIEKAAAGAIEAGTEADGVAVLPAQIDRARTGSTIVIGNRKLAVEVADGVARIAALDITAPEATLRNLTVVDLATLKADSEWRVTPRRPLPGKAAGNRRDPLPSIVLVWAGPLGNVAAVTPRLSAEALEREITIRRMERETERLEDLRRLDEQRAIEAERARRTEDGQHPPVSGQAVQQTETAPVIQAPLPITQGAAGTQPPAAVTRPPQPRPPPRQGTKTLFDALMGNQ
jgi:hypothetical protein